MKYFNSIKLLAKRCTHRREEKRRRKRRRSGPPMAS
jgi:hypothetical protein